VTGQGGTTATTVVTGNVTSISPDKRTLIIQTINNALTSSFGGGLGGSSGTANANQYVAATAYVTVIGD
jgi:hypothetical protein